MAGNVIEEKTFEFAVKVVGMCRWLQNQKKEYILSKQLLRAGTSIGANVQEAQAGQSKKDFIAKMAIASKEARETRYWLRLLTETGYLVENDAKEALSEINGIISILTKIVKTSQYNQ